MPIMCDSADQEEAVVILTLAANGDTTYCCLRCLVEAAAAMANATGMMQVSVTYPEDQAAPPPPAEEGTDNGTPPAEGSGRGRRPKRAVAAVPAEPEGSQPPPADPE